MKHISHYEKSGFDNSWWIVFRTDRPRKFFGMNPPKKSKFRIVYDVRLHPSFCNNTFSSNFKAQ